MDASQINIGMNIIDNIDSLHIRPDAGVNVQDVIADKPHQVGEVGHSCLVDHKPERKNDRCR